MDKLNKIVLIGGAIIIGLLLFIAVKPINTVSDNESLGSLSIGSSYKSTTTPGVALVPVIKTGSGTFGSVITTITGTGSLTIYDATTTVATQRALATSSLRVLAYFGASPTVGTYTFDSSYYDGLMAVWGTGTVSTTTITYR